MIFQDNPTLLTYLLILTLLGLVEGILSDFFVPGYVRMGIPIYVRRITSVRKKQFLLLSERLPATKNRNFWYPVLAFKLMGRNEIAFRHKLLSLDFGLANNKPFRGIIRYEPETQSIILSGKLTFFEPFYLVGIIWYMWYGMQRFEHVMPDLSPFSSQSDFVLFLVQILIVIRAFQAVSLHKFGQHLEKLLSNKTI